MDVLLGQSWHDRASEPFPVKSVKHYQERFILVGRICRIYPVEGCKPESCKSLANGLLAYSSLLVLPGTYGRSVRPSCFDLGPLGSGPWSYLAK